MSNNPTPKGPWITRFAIRLFTVILFVLFYWVLGFLVQDIKSIAGPRYEDVSERYVKQELVDRSAALEIRIEDLERRTVNQREKQRVVRDSSLELQKSIRQLIELHKLSLQKDIAVSEAEKDNLTRRETLFLERQEEYERLNASISEVMTQKQKLEDEKRGIDHEVKEQHKPARVEFDRLYKQHRLKLAAWQLLVLIPMLVAGAFFVLRKRSSIRYPLYLAFAVAALLKVTQVIHEYFPTRYFKYILIVVLLLAVIKLLLHFIKVVTHPKAQWLTKQYREAYERFLCPICEYPIRTGPRRFLFWTRRSVKKPLPHQGDAGDEEIYTCPSCGTALYEACSACSKTRHALLPHCRHCGSEKDLT